MIENVERIQQNHLMGGEDMTPAGMELHENCQL
jgi:hypothetical protein